MKLGKLNISHDWSHDWKFGVFHLGIAVYNVKADRDASFNYSAAIGFGLWTLNLDIWSKA